MRGMDQQQYWMFSYISAERRVSKENPLRAIREMADAALARGAVRCDLHQVGVPSLTPDQIDY
jgi:hypothetical protein